jgi:outer membrane protein assembly factor BamB
MKSYWLKSFVGGGVLLAGCSGTLAADWPQYRGFETEGISAEKISAVWPASGPKLRWRVPASTGFSSFVVAGGKVFTVVARPVDGTLSEVCVAWDADSGKELWAAPMGIAKYQGGGESGAEDNKGGDGPRSTPAANAGRVFIYSTDMVLRCLDAGTGKPIWQKNVLAEFQGKNIGWKSAMSPVLDGNLIYVAGGGAGQSMLAFNQASGEVVWKTGDESMTHASPTVATIQGVRQVIFLMQSGLVGLDAASGKPLWSFPFPYRTSTGCSPVVAGNIVFCTAGYDVGGAACQVVKNGAVFEAKELWRIKGNADVASLWSTPVQKDGFLYGMISFKKFANGPLKCVDLKTGEIKWQQPGFGAGQVMLAGNYLITLADDGTVALVEASPAAYKELARFKAIAGKCWSGPALSNGRLFVRSTKEGACFDLPMAK